MDKISGSTNIRLTLIFFAFLIFYSVYMDIEMNTKSILTIIILTVIFGVLNTIRFSENKK